MIPTGRAISEPMAKSSQDEPAWSRVRKFVAGYASGCCLVLVGHPFDTIKVRIQSEGSTGRFQGVVHCVKQTVKLEGFRGLYKGMSAPLFLTGGVNSVLFGMQFNFVTELAKRRAAVDGGAVKPQVEDSMKAALLSGFLISALVTPMEGIKARLQVQYSSSSEALYKGPWDCARKVYQELGLTRGIYRGWIPVCFSRMSNYSYFGSYALISASLADLTRVEGQPAGPLPPWAAVIAGGSAGVCYWLSCYPMDVIKNRIMAQPDTKVPLMKNTRDAFRQVYRKEGLRGFFLGFTPCALRAFPANAAAFLGFELAMRILPE